MKRYLIIVLMLCALLPGCAQREFVPSDPEAGPAYLAVKLGENRYASYLIDQDRETGEMHQELLGMDYTSISEAIGAAEKRAYLKKSQNAQPDTATD